MKKTIWIVSGVALLILLIGVGYLWYSMGEPLYKPGMVRAGKNLRAPLSPPLQTDVERFWIVESDIRLKHFEHGAELYAAEYPEHVQALVLVSPADMLVMPGQDSDLFETVRGRLPEGMRPEFDAYMEEYLNFNSLFTQSEVGDFLSHLE